MGTIVKPATSTTQGPILPSVAMAQMDEIKTSPTGRRAHSSAS